MELGAKVFNDCSAFLSAAFVYHPKKKYDYKEFSNFVFSVFEERIEIAKDGGVPDLGSENDFDEEDPVEEDEDFFDMLFPIFHNL